MIVHWPAGLKTRPGATTAQIGYVTDFMPTLLTVCGASYPKKHGGSDVPPPEGEDLAPTFAGRGLAPRVLCMEHEGNRMAREGDWKLVALAGKLWELYDLARDPAEMIDRAGAEPARVRRMSADWDAWAVRCGVVPRPSPVIAGLALDIRCDVTAAAQGDDGVILAQGGSQRGYALYLRGSRPVFGVREAGTLYTAVAPAAPAGRFSLEARLEMDGTMTLSVNGAAAARAKAPGVIAVQPEDGLSIGEDILSAVGDYTAPHPLRGKVENVRITAGAKRYDLGGSAAATGRKVGPSAADD